MEKKRYERAEQKLINIAVDPLLFTNSTTYGDDNCPGHCYQECDHYCSYDYGCDAVC